MAPESSESGVGPGSRMHQPRPHGAPRLSHAPSLPNNSFLGQSIRQLICQDWSVRAQHWYPRDQCHVPYGIPGITFSATNWD